MCKDTTAVEAVGLGMRYERRREHVLRDCSFRLPTGRICALVGPNGAGKSTLLALAAGLLRPTDGAIRVLGSAPAQARERFAYVAQNKPLYPQLTIAAMLRLGAELNPGRWDQAAAERIAYGSDLAPATKIRAPLRRPAHPHRARPRLRQNVPNSSFWTSGWPTSTRSPATS